MDYWRTVFKAVVTVASDNGQMKTQPSDVLKHELLCIEEPPDGGIWKVVDSDFARHGELVVVRAGVADGQKIEALPFDRAVTAEMKLVMELTRTMRIEVQQISQSTDPVKLLSDLEKLLSPFRVFADPLREIRDRFIQTQVLCGPDLLALNSLLGDVKQAGSLHVCS